MTPAGRVPRRGAATGRLGRFAAVDRLRRFAAIGVVVTAVDVGVLVALARGAGWPVAAADAAAIVAAACCSYLLNRAVTFAGDPSVRWVFFPAAFALTALLGGLLDVAVLVVAVRFLDPGGPWGLVAAKVPAVALAAAFRLRVYRGVLFDEVRADLAARADRPPAPGAVRLSVVVPAYSEEARIASTIERLRAGLAEVAEGGDLEIVVVDDGSPDATAAAARAAGAEQVVVQPANRGKGAAVRAGMLAARGRTVAFTDADLAYPPDQILRLLGAVEDGWDVVVGSRRHAEATTLVRASRLRDVGGRVINRFTHAVLLGHYRDTQCGLKAFRSDVARVLFGRSRIDGFAFDVELFHLVERYRLSLTEVPVAVENSERSTVHVVRDGFRLVRDLLRLQRDGRRGRYDLTDEEAATLAAPGASAEGGVGGR